MLKLSKAQEERASAPDRAKQIDPDDDFQVAGFMACGGVAELRSEAASSTMGMANLGAILQASDAKPARSKNRKALSRQDCALLAEAVMTGDMDLSLD